MLPLDVGATSGLAVVRENMLNAIYSDLRKLELHPSRDQADRAVIDTHAPLCYWQSPSDKRMAATPSFKVEYDCSVSVVMYNQIELELGGSWDFAIIQHYPPEVQNRITRLIRSHLGECWQVKWREDHHTENMEEVNAVREMESHQNGSETVITVVKHKWLGKLANALHKNNRTHSQTQKESGMMKENDVVGEAAQKSSKSEVNPMTGTGLTTQTLEVVKLADPNSRDSEAVPLPESTDDKILKSPESSEETIPETKLESLQNFIEQTIVNCVAHLSAEGKLLPPGTTTDQPTLNTQTQNQTPSHNRSTTRRASNTSKRSPRRRRTPRLQYSRHGGRYCTGCGAKIKNADEFCYQCGRDTASQIGRQ